MSDPGGGVVGSVSPALRRELERKTGEAFKHGTETEQLGPLRPRRTT
jgi:hypothetical protein